MWPLRGKASASINVAARARQHVPMRTTLAPTLALGLLALAGCTSSDTATTLASAAGPTREAPPVKFTEAEYGVAASPRLAYAGSRIPKGGGHFKVGKPYKVRGKWYHPKEDHGYDRVGKASWYGPNFHGRKTANGEVFDQYHLSAAHTTFPLPSYARVTNVANGRSVIVRVNDRGPYSHRRIIDVSKKAAEVLGFKQQGTADVRVEYVGRAPLEGDDMPKLLASIGAGKDGRASSPLAALGETASAARALAVPSVRRASGPLPPASLTRASSTPSTKAVRLRGAL